MRQKQIFSHFFHQKKRKHLNTHHQQTIKQYITRKANNNQNTSHSNLDSHFKRKRHQSHGQKSATKITPTTILNKYAV